MLSLNHIFQRIDVTLKRKSVWKENFSLFYKQDELFSDLLDVVTSPHLTSDQFLRTDLKTFKRAERIKDVLFSFSEKQLSFIFVEIEVK